MLLTNPQNRVGQGKQPRGVPAPVALQTGAITHHAAVTGAAPQPGQGSGARGTHPPAGLGLLLGSHRTLGAASGPEVPTYGGRVPVETAAPAAPPIRPTARLPAGAALGARIPGQAQPSCGRGRALTSQRLAHPGIACGRSQTPTAPAARGGAATPVLIPAPAFPAPSPRPPAPPPRCRAGAFLTPPGLSDSE